MTSFISHHGLALVLVLVDIINTTNLLFNLPLNPLSITTSSTTNPAALLPRSRPRSSKVPRPPLLRLILILILIILIILIIRLLLSRTPQRNLLLAFDLAWSCNSLGGQWNAVYRHGTMRSCSRHWDDFWFCMRTKSFSGPAREDAVREHYRRIEYEKYYAPGCRSSEDVWEPRTHRVPEGTAFVQPIDLPAVNDEDWRRAEDERRGRIRKDLGF
ncbi:hypothetical protein ESCO_001921 [Escovopsis weberi]|uniref:Early meiotic induction protein 1 n=1 Tax=Escovopsis weberi TaxID=150374 RepID=A0A0M9VWK0_ESCWE|nr:hypothetical protein ESCO_001921 [Escovopsis weberi]